MSRALRNGGGGATSSGGALGGRGAAVVARPCSGVLSDITNVSSRPFSDNAVCGVAAKQNGGVPLNVSLGGNALGLAPPHASFGTEEASCQHMSATLGSGTSAATPLQALESDVSPGDVDGTASADPQNVAEYAVDIYKHLGARELEMMPRPDYMDQQLEINWKMREILVDWLVEVHMKHRLRTETLFLTVNLVDRYLCIAQVARRRLQLVGVAAMLIASKFEEIYPPETRDFVYITDNAYTKEEVLSMEVSMLTALGFNLCCPTVAHFLERYQRLNNCNQVHHHLLQYILELTLPDYSMIRYSPSHLAAAAALLSNKLMKRHPTWPPALARHACQPDVQVRECMRELCKLLSAAEHGSCQAVRKKFSQAAYSGVARLVV